MKVHRNVAFVLQWKYIKAVLLIFSLLWISYTISRLGFAGNHERRTITKPSAIDKRRTTSNSRQSNTVALSHLLNNIHSKAIQLIRVNYDTMVQSIPDYFFLPESNYSAFRDFLQKDYSVIKFEITKSFRFRKPAVNHVLVQTIDNSSIEVLLLIDVANYYIVESPEHIKDLPNIAAFEKADFVDLVINERWYEFAHLIGYRNAIKTCSFISCDVERAARWRKNANASLPSEMKRENTRKILQHAKKTLKDLGMKLILGHGTLLGWYRECDVISHTSDVDADSFMSEYNASIVTTFLHKSPVRLLYIFGLVTEGLEITLWGFGVKLDIFMLFKENDRYYSGSIDPNTRQKYRNYYNTTDGMYQVCSADFLGDLHLIPCDPSSIIIQEYGETWDKPVSELYFNYRTSPRNVITTGNFTEKEWKTAFQVFQSASQEMRFKASWQLSFVCVFLCLFHINLLSHF